jgi:dihydrofolate reductase
MSKVVVIAAVGEWNERKYIGESNKMPWLLPRDLRFFRTVTDGGAVIMGRKTFESLNRRLLPNRENVVVTRQRDYEVKGGTVVHSLPQALDVTSKYPYVFVIGGGQLFTQAIPIADHLLITEIHHTSRNEPLFEVFRGDTFFPAIDSGDWTRVKTSRWFKATAARTTALLPPHHAWALYFRFIRFDRTKDLASAGRPPKLFFGKGQLIAKPKPQAASAPQPGPENMELSLDHQPESEAKGPQARLN